jgi:two-component system response regulator NreC
MVAGDPITILIADDHAVLRAGLRALLSRQPDMVVVGDANNGALALRMTRQLRPDLLLLDISMPGVDGLEVLLFLQEQSPNTNVLILTMYEDASFLRETLRLGARGYIPKRAAEVDLLDAIRAVHRGEVYVHPSMTELLVQDYVQTLRSGAEDDSASSSSDEQTSSSGCDLLSPREVDVLTLVAKGYTDRQIADRLVISVRTVESHKANIRKKLGRRSRVELVRYALEHGLLGS